MTNITLPDPDTHCWDDDVSPPKDVWSYSPDLVRQIVEAACAWQREQDEAICDKFSQDAYARYRASRREYDDGQCDAANALADKIRSGS